MGRQQHVRRGLRPTEISTSTNLLETIILQAEVLELKANPDLTASGFVIEANLDKGRGPVATVIVQRGTCTWATCSRRGLSFGQCAPLVDPQGAPRQGGRPADLVEILPVSEP